MSEMVVVYYHFRDRDGNEWRVYAYRVTAGHVTYGHPGRPGSQYRGFVPVDGGPRRCYLMNTMDPRELPIEEANFQRQLDASKIYFRDDPTHPAFIPGEYGRLGKPSKP